MNINPFALIGGSGLLLVLATLIYAAGNESRINEIQNAAELTSFLKEHPQAIVFFYNPSCPVCRAFMRKGIFPQSAAHLPHVGFAQVSSVQAQPVHRQFSITAFPTFVYFKNGHELKRDVGYVENPAFSNKLRKVFAQ